MKKTVLCAALIGAASTAVADDHALAGFYAGAQMTRVQAATTVEDSDCWFNCSAYTIDEDSFEFGLQAGYNHVSGNLLLGAELDYVAGGPSGDYEYGYYSGTNDEMKISAEVSSLASLQLKMGLALDKTAIILAAGPARMDVDNEFRDRNNFNTQYVAAQSGDLSGWVSSVRIEHAFTDGVSGGLSLSSYDFEDEDSSLFQDDGTNQFNKVNFVNDVQTFSLYANYNF